MTATIRFCQRDVPVDEHRLVCVNTHVDDLAPLRALVGLRELRLQNTNPHEPTDPAVSDLSPLAGLRQLEVIELPGAPVADLGPLAGLSRLRRLDVARSGVCDLAPLAGLRALTSLDLASTPVADLAPL